MSSANQESEVAETALPAASRGRWRRRATERPEELFQAAFDVFMEKGFLAARLEDIASKAGVTRPLVYHYFADKEDLLLQSLEWSISGILADMLSEIGPAEDGTRTRLRRLFEFSWKRWRTPRWSRFNCDILPEIRRESPLLYRRWIEQSLVKRWKMVEDILRDGIRRGEVRPDLDPRAASRFLVSGGIQLALLHLHSEIPEFAPCSEKALRETALGVFLRGILPDPPASPG